MTTVCTACFGRPEIFRLWCMNFSTLNPRPIMVAGGFADDPCKAVAIEYGVHYYDVCNDPLGLKFNLIFGMAYKNHPSDYYLIMGSDDLMSAKMWSFYSNFRGDYLGLSDYWFHRMGTQEAMYWRGYPEGSKRENEPIGACRMISHAVLEKMHGQPFSDHNDRIDYDFHHKTLATGAELVSLKCHHTGGISVDLKTEHNKNTWKLFSNSEYRPYSDIAKAAPDLDMIIQSCNYKPYLFEKL